MRELDRRGFLKTALFAAGGLALPGVLAACGREGAPARAASMQALAGARIRAGAKRGLSVFLAGEDYVEGIRNYLAFGLVQDEVGPVMGSAASVWLAPTADPAAEVEPEGPVTAAWQGYAKPDAGPPAPQGINAADLSFEQAGIWAMLVEAEADGGRLLGSAAIQVKPKSGTRIPGEKAIASQTPTLDDYRGVEPICTRTPPCDFHRVTLAEALTLGKPTAFIVATPRFCQSRTCGPNLEELIAVSEEVGDRASFVHAEVYKDDQEAPARQIVSPTFAEWSFQSEPWLFLIQPGGVIASRFEGPVTASVIRRELSPLVS